MSSGLTRAGAVMEGGNELAGENNVPSSAEEGWRVAPGWCWSRNMMELDQHHPYLDSSVKREHFSVPPLYEVPDPVSASPAKVAVD